MSHWRKDSCSRCGGYGVVSVYSANDFEGPGECQECGGTGTLFVSEKDRVAMYPGGPLRGTDPGRYVKLGGDPE